jgi:hypothetical protein
MKRKGGGNDRDDDYNNE